GVGRPTPPLSLLGFRFDQPSEVLGMTLDRQKKLFLLGFVLLLIFGLAAKNLMRSKIGRALSADRKSTRLNSSHVKISYAVFCLIRPPPLPTLFPYTTLFRSRRRPPHTPAVPARIPVRPAQRGAGDDTGPAEEAVPAGLRAAPDLRTGRQEPDAVQDRAGALR